MFERLKPLIEKELIQFVRDRVLLGTVILFPVLLLLLMGNALSSTFSDNAIAIIDYDHSSLSREIISLVENSRELSVKALPDNLEMALTLMDEKYVAGIILIPPNLMEDVQNPTTQPAIQIYVDGSQVLRAGITMGYAAAALGEVGADLVSIPAGYSPGGITTHSEPLFNASLDYTYNSITSMLSLLLFTVTLLIAIMGVVREKEVGTIEMLSITPLTQLEMIAGKAITPMIVGTFNFFSLFVIVRTIFGIPNRGSFALLLPVTMFYLLCEVGFALLLSTNLSTQHQAVTFGFIWIMIGLCFSGYFVDIHTLPVLLQRISDFIPLRHYMNIIQTIMLKGGGFRHIWVDLLWLALLTSAAYILAIRSMRDSAK